MYVGYLRRKLEQAGARPLIHTVRGVGYVLARAVTLRARIARASAGARRSAGGSVHRWLAPCSLYVAVRSELRGEVDRSLTQRATRFTRAPARASGGYGISGARPEAPPPPRSGERSPRQWRPGLEARFPSSVEPAPLGGPSGYVQFVSPAGAVHVPGGQGSSTTIPVSAPDRAIANVVQGAP